MGIRSWWKNLRGSGRGDSFFDSENIPTERIPFHLGIIMDGNGRWAARKGLPVLAGHREGTRALKRTVEAAREFGVSQLTVYSFSTENWSREPGEVKGLLGLLEEMIEKEVPELDEQGVKVVFVGRRRELGDSLVEKMAEAEAKTAGNARMTLFVAFNYGGRAEVVDAVRDAIEEGVEPGDLDEAEVSRRLYAPEMRPPDLVIRTSGERRLSNFLLWESAYSELYFSEVLWPDYSREELEKALRDYAGRERRFGRREAGEIG